MLPPHGDLSDREKEILRLVATGASNKEIAQELYISTNTVKVHLRNIFTKIGASSRTEAAMYAVNHGLVQSIPQFNEKPEPAPSPETFQVDSKIHKTEWLLIVLIVLLVSIGVFYYFLFKSPGVISLQNNNNTPRWRILAPMLTARYSFATTAIEDRIYSIGGETSYGLTEKVERYDTVKNSWEIMAPKPTSVSEVGSVAIQGKIYVPGGRLQSSDVTNVLEIFEPDLNLWTKGSPLPKKLSAYVVSAYEGKMYLFGGWDGYEVSRKVYEYNPDRDAWRELAEMASPRAYAGVAVAGGEILILGGEDGQKILSSIETFLPSNGTFDRNPFGLHTSMPEPIYKMGVSSLADMIYIVGGESSEDRKYPTLVLFNETGEWGSFEQPDNDTGAELSLVSWGTYIYAIGGLVDQKPSDQNQAYRAIYTVIFPLIR